MQTKGKIFLGHGDIANYITLLGLILSLSSCFCALNGNIQLSVTFFIVSGICDLFDGAVARRIKRTDWEKEFGVQLDTVADVVSFGAAPVIIVFATAGKSWYALAAYAFYIVCAVIRLAHFNTSVNINTSITHYQGLPVTYIALILPIAMIFRSAPASVLTLFIVGILFILYIKIPKPQGIWYVIFPALAVALSVLWWIL